MNEPSAVTIKLGTWAVKSSLPPPTASELFAPTPVRPRGYDGGVVHGTSCQSVLGYDALKHPFFGRGVRDMDARHAFQSPDRPADGPAARVKCSDGEVCP